MSTLVGRNVRINGRRTSVKLEPAMWDALAEICVREGMGIGKLRAKVEGGRAGASFTSALRVFIVEYYRAALAALRPSMQIGVRYEPAVSSRAVTALRTGAPAGLRTR